MYYMQQYNDGYMMAPHYSAIPYNPYLQVTTIIIHYSNSVLSHANILFLPFYLGSCCSIQLQSSNDGNIWPPNAPRCYGNTSQYARSLSSQ